MSVSVSSNTARASGKPVGQIIVNADEESARVIAGFALDGGSMNLVRMSVGDMDELAMKWIDARRVCPFCKEPFMDVDLDGQPRFECVVTLWQCEHCGGSIETTWEPDRVPWEDPIGETR